MGRFAYADDASGIGLANQFVEYRELSRGTLALAASTPPRTAVSDMFELCRRGEDLSLAAPGPRSAFNAGRTYDLPEFTSAWRAASERRREDTCDTKEEDR
jgi:hypothetical protein